MNPEHRQFYRDVIDNLQSNNLAIFAGAGLSKAAGYVDWKGLLKEIAEDLGLSIDQENDLISIAQYNANKIGSRSMLNQKIIDEFNEDVDLTENHKILARLPIRTFWTTNYDDLIERSLKTARKIADVKHSVSQLSTSIHRRDALVYKMHGDATMPNDATLTKDDYERYFHDKAPFITALSGDLVSKLFLFVGFSFTDPNLDFIFSRVKFHMKGAVRHHYFFVKRIMMEDADVKDKADFEYKSKKQQHFIEDLKRFQLQPVYIDTYQEITFILKEIESQFKKRTVFISGSAEEYGPWDRLKGQQFIHILSAKLIREGFRIVNGFGWGVGSAVINGALEQIHLRPEKFNEDQLIVKPFPQFETGEKKLPELWAEYRDSLIGYAGAAIFIFGNKLDSEGVKNIEADGIRKELEIARGKRLFLLPVKSTGYISEKIYDELVQDDYYQNIGNKKLSALLEKLKAENDIEKMTDLIIEILKTTTE